MKSLIINTLCLLVCVQLNAQGQQQVLNTSEKGNGIWLKFETSKQTSAAKLVQDKTALQLGTNDGLKPISTDEDQLGYRHHRYQQTYKGIPIEDAIFILHEKNNLVAKANGSLIADLNITTIPAISKEVALQAALQYTNAAEYAWQNVTYENLIKDIKNDPDATFYPEGELIIVNAQRQQKTTDYKLVYMFDIYALEPQTRQYVYVDAQTCEVLMIEERMHSCTDHPASGVTNYSQVVNFTACQDDNAGYILKNTIGGDGMKLFDALNTNDSPFIPFTDTDNVFDSTPTANEVHWAVEKTRDYYSVKHDRESIDNNGMQICSWINYQSASGNRNNAYWNGMFLQFGTGDGVNYTSFTSPDIVAHEYTHGVIDFTANLRYYKEHGALNESFSDIFGEVAERHMRGTNDWIIGADFVANPDFNGIRNMSNPKDAMMITQQPDTYLGENWHTGWKDNGGVHTNSGIQNYWFYLLAEGGSGVNDNGDAYNVSGITIDKAAAIAYRNLAVHLTPASEYADARIGAIQAAEDLYGIASNEALQTEAAWDAVGVAAITMNCRTRDSLALVALYDATDGAHWTNIWDLAQPMDTWYGVLLSESGCLIELQLYDNNLVGNIPSEIGNLYNLEELDISENQLSGGIPSEIGNLYNLKELDISENQLSGGISSEIGNLNDLRWLELSDNPLGGNIPSEIWNLNNLTTLYLDNIQLSGSIPPEIGDLNDLRALDLDNNQFSGNIPPEIGNLNDLYYLSLGNNQLSGGIPPEIWNLKKLSNLYLSDNPLGGSIPPEIGNLEYLFSLNLNNNQLSGSIPSEIGNSNNLTALYLGNNQLSGSIPPEIGNLGYLTTLYLDNNQLSGCYDPNLINLYDAGSNYSVSSGNNFDTPWEDFRYYGVGVCNNPYPDCRYNDSLALVAFYNSTNGAEWANTWDLTQPINTWHGVNLNGFGCVASLNLGSNNLSGSIPPEIGNLNNLTLLILWNNQLSGTIPPQIGNLNNLTYLSLWGNQLSGSIPPEIGNLNNLRVLDLHWNELSDSIPSQMGNLNNLTCLFLNGNQLSGSIPSQIGSLNYLKELDLSNNQLSGSIPLEIGSLNYLREIVLSDNQLTGSIPPQIGSLNDLIRLNLHNNQLSGCYDQNLMNLCSQLTSIYNTYFSISEGNNFDVPWDEFCNTGVGICGYAITTVYPGDFNNDGTANATDLLYWGLEVGSTGFSRFPASNDWTPQEAYWWEAVHQDGDGNGTVDFNDIATLEQNYDSTYLSIPPYTPNQGLISYELKLDSIAPLPGPQRQLYFGLYVISETGVPVSTHGLAGTIDCSLLYMELNIEPEMETMGSVLEPTADITHYDVVEKQLHFALTRTDKNNQLLGNSPVANIVVVDDLKLAGEVERIISANSGSLMHANGSAIPVGATTLTVSIGNGGGTNELTGSVITSDEQCNLPGWAKVEAENGKFPYTYQWSNGANTQIVNNLAAGDYTVTIVDNIGSTLVISSEINPSDSIYDGDGNQLDCNGERVHATLDLCVLLEGAYDNVTQQMRTTLNTERGLLPGQTPSSSLVSPTPPGQPYNQSPWNYEGIEGQGWSDMNYSSEVVDWVLVSFRTGISASTEITKTAGLLMKGGCIDFPDRNVLPKNIGSPLYIVIEHRNHMGIMTTDSVNIINNTLTYDFRLSDSYNGGGTGSGQKQLPDGNWAMFVGDCDQTDFPSYDITGADKSIWATDNGNFDVYNLADFNLDGDVNGADKGFWFDNNGISSRVPK